MQEKKNLCVLCIHPLAAWNGGYVPELSTAARELDGIFVEHDSGEKLVVFGHKRQREDDMERGLLAALNIRDKIFGEDGRFLFSMGLSYGPVTFDPNQLKSLKGSVLREAIALAKRSFAGACLVSRQIASIYRRRYDFNRVSFGKKELPELADKKPWPGRLRGLSESYGAFVGRKKELDEIALLVEQIEVDQGQMAGIVAEAGVGKTRFTFEAKRIFKREGVPYYEGAFSGIKQSDFSAVKSVILDMLDLGGGDIVPDPKIIRKALSPYGMEHSDVEFLARLLSLKGLDTLEDSGLDEEQLKDATANAIKKFFFKAALNTRKIIIFEDVHWADKASLNLFHMLCEGLSTPKLLVYLIYRPVIPAPWENELVFNKIELKPFTEQETLDLLKKLLGAENIPYSFLRFMHRRSNGNPFYIEEILRHMLEEGSLELKRAKDGSREIKFIKKLEKVPRTVQGVIAGRIDIMERYVKKMIEQMAVCGFEFDSNQARFLAKKEGIKPKEFETGLKKLQAEGFLVEKSLYPEERYFFKHALTYDVARSLPSTRRRKRLNTLAGDFLVRKYRYRKNQFSPDIADHYLAGDDTAKAVLWGLRAGKLLYEKHQKSESLKYYEAVEKICRRGGAAMQARRKEALAGIVTVLTELGKTDVAQSYLNMLKRLLPKIVNKEWFPFIKSHVEIYNYNRQYEKLLKLSSMYLELIKKLPRCRHMKLWLSIKKSWALIRLERFDEAFDLCKEWKKLIPPGDNVSEIKYLRYISDTLIAKGLLAEAKDNLIKALRLAEKIDNVYEIYTIYDTFPLLSIKFEDRSEQLMAVRIGEDLVEKTGIISLVPLAKNNISDMYMLMGDLVRAKDTMDETELFMKKHSIKTSPGYFYYTALQLALELGSVENALKAAETVRKNYEKTATRDFILHSAECLINILEGDMERAAARAVAAGKLLSQAKLSSSEHLQFSECYRLIYLYPTVKSEIEKIFSHWNNDTESPIGDEARAILMLSSAWSALKENNIAAANSTVKQLKDHLKKCHNLRINAEFSLLESVLSKQSKDPNADSLKMNAKTVAKAMLKKVPQDFHDTFKKKLIKLVPQFSYLEIF